MPVWVVEAFKDLEALTAWVGLAGVVGSKMTSMVQQMASFVAFGRVSMALRVAMAMVLVHLVQEEFVEWMVTKVANFTWQTQDSSVDLLFYGSFPNILSMTMGYPCSQCKDHLPMDWTVTLQYCKFSQYLILNSHLIHY